MHFESGLCLSVKPTQYGEGLLIVGEQQLQKPEGDRKRRYFFRRDGQPEECDVRAGDGGHPVDLRGGADRKQDV